MNEPMHIPSIDPAINSIERELFRAIGRRRRRAGMTVAAVAAALLLAASATAAAVIGIDTGVKPLDDFLGSRHSAATPLPNARHVVLRAPAGDGETWTMVAYEGGQQTVCSVAAVNPSDMRFPVSGPACESSIVLVQNFARIGVRAHLSSLTDEDQHANRLALYGVAAADTEEVTAVASDGTRTSAVLSKPFTTVRPAPGVGEALVDGADRERLLAPVRVRGFLVTVPPSGTAELSLEVHRADGTLLRGHP